MQWPTLFQPARFGKKIFPFILCFLFFSVSQAQDKRIFKEKRTFKGTQNFSTAIYKYPIMFFANGGKTGIDFNVRDKYMFGFEITNINTHNPVFYKLITEKSGTSIGIEATPDLVVERRLKINYKNFIGKYSTSFHGVYMSPFVEMGSGAEIIRTTLGKGFGSNLTTNVFSYRRFGLCFGKQATVFNKGVVDLNVGIGFNKFRNSSSRLLYNKLEGQKNNTYLIASLGLGLGIPKGTVEMIRKPRSEDSLIFNYGLTLSLNQILQSGFQLDFYTKNKNKSLWNFHALYRSNANTIVNLSWAEEFESYGGGLQYRLYPAANLYRNGLYYGIGYDFEKSKATMVNNKDTIVGQYFPHQFSTSIGFTTILNDVYLIDLYVSGILTLSKSAYTIYPRPNEASGVRTEMGIKFGIAQFKY
ncbi:MAG: hypothetical protein H6607_13130 [Flavobacteriales bacterium]|nr:hypothetical protein [Flavobacteriales bacterium]